MSPRRRLVVLASSAAFSEAGRCGRWAEPASGLAVSVTLPLHRN